MMLVVGLTGSTGSGKGYVCGRFSEVGIPCLDTDIVCRQVYMKGEKCYADMIEYFGDGILGDDGEIDRKKLYQVAFTDRDKYEVLTSIAYLYIMKATEKWLDEKRNEGAEIAVIDAPMLFESGFDRLCDKVVCVTSDRPTQISRVMFRDGISEEVAVSRLEKQKSNQYYISRSEFCLDNSVSRENKFDADVSRLIRKLRKIAAEKV